MGQGNAKQTRPGTPERVLGSKLRMKTRNELRFRACVVMPWYQEIVMREGLAKKFHAWI
jgi:hypothetical protein